MLFSTPLNQLRSRAAAMRMCAYLSDPESTYKSCVAFLLTPHFAQAGKGAVEALCRKGTTDAHGEWTAVFRHFVDMKLQLPHFRGWFDSLPTLVVPFLRSMQHLSLSCNGLVFAVIQSRISLTLPAHGPQAKI